MIELVFIGVYIYLYLVYLKFKLVNLKILSIEFFLYFFEFSKNWLIYLERVEFIFICS